MTIMLSGKKLTPQYPSQLATTFIQVKYTSGFLFASLYCWLNSKYNRVVGGTTAASTHVSWDENKETELQDTLPEVRENPS